MRTAWSAGGLLVSVALALWAALALHLPSLATGWLPLSFLLPLVATVVLGILLRRDLLALLAIVVLVNVPFLTGVVWDTRDTIATYEMFHTIYGEFFHSGRLLLWLPYSTYGQPAEYVTGSYCSGVDFLFLLLGRAIRLRNTWLLFCLARIGEQVVFVMGTFLLSRALFTRRSTVFMVCLASAGGLSWYWHLFFNLRLFYFLPFALLFLLWFFERRRPEFLWLSGLSCVFAGQGASYVLCVWLFVLLIVSSILFIAHRDAWRWVLARSWRNALALSLFLAMAGSFVYVSVTAMQGFTFTKSGRDPQTGRVPLDDYLHHGGNPRLNRLARDLFSGDTDVNQWDSSFYVGLAPLFFLAWGLARERSAPFWAVASAGVGVVWLSFGGAFAALTYYLPFMSYYRWLAWVVPLARVLMVLAAGFGFERFWTDRDRRGLALGIVALLVFMIDGAGVPVQDVYPLIALYAAVAGAAFFIGTWSRPALTHAEHGEWAGAATRVALVIVLGIDVLTYQRRAHEKLPRRPPADIAVLAVSRLEYLDVRTREPRSPRALRAVKLAPSGYPVNLQNFLQWDSCALGGPEPDYLMMVPSGVHRLLSVRSLDDPALQEVVGCEAPKVRLVGQAVYAKDDPQASKLTRLADDLARVAVLELPKGVAPPPPGPERRSASGRVEVTAFSANRVDLVADVDDPAGAWLVYADGYHRGWRATVNGKGSPIAKAYLAFKAVWLPGGRSVVRLSFWDGLTSALMYLLAIWSLLVDLLLLGWLVKLLLEPSPQRRETGPVAPTAMRLAAFKSPRE